MVGHSIRSTHDFRLKRGAVLREHVVTEVGALGRLLALHGCKKCKATVIKEVITLHGCKKCKATVIKEVIKLHGCKKCKATVIKEVVTLHDCKSVKIL